MMSNTIDLIIKTINNEVYNYTVGLDSTILSLKSSIRETTSIEEERQRLIYKGRVLTDETIINDYKIENGHTIHMVARPSNYQQLREQSSPTETATSTTTPSLSGRVSIPSVTLSPPNSDNESLEHIRQGLLSIHTLISTMDPTDFRQSRSGANILHSSNSQCFNNRSVKEILSNSNKNDNKNYNTDDDIMDVDFTNGINLKDCENFDKQFDETVEREIETINCSEEITPIDNNNNRNNQEIDAFQISAITRKFFKGQWVDVKDTVSQWLEATVMDINYEQSKIFVHYNGWPERWDEWIAWDSPRISPFRSRTNHSSLNPFASPTPNIIVASAPNTGPNDLRLLLPEFAHLFRTLSPLMEEMSTLAEDSFSSRPIAGFSGNMTTEASSSSSRSTLRYRGSGTSGAENNESHPIMTSGMPWEDVLHRHNNINNNEVNNVNSENQRRQKLKSDNDEQIQRVSDVGIGGVSKMDSNVNLPNSKISSSSFGITKAAWEDTAEANSRIRENKKRDMSSVDSEFKQSESIKRPAMNAQQKEARMTHLAKELCPLVDRFGRVLTDLSPLLRDMVESGNPSSSSSSAPSSTTNNAALSIEASLLSLLRERPPSPPPERSYRAPISTHPRIPVTSGMRATGIGIGTNTTTGTSGFLSELLGSAIGNGTGTGSTTTRTENGHHVDIHIAILQPSPTRTTATEGTALSQTVSSLTASLQAQAQSLAQRTQELSVRSQQVSGYSSALNEIMRIVQSDEQRIDEINSQIRAIQSSSNSNDLDNDEPVPDLVGGIDDIDNPYNNANQMEEDEDDEHLNTEILNDLIPPENEERNNQSLIARSNIQNETTVSSMDLDENISNSNKQNNEALQRQDNETIEQAQTAIGNEDNNNETFKSNCSNDADNNNNNFEILSNSSSTSQRLPSNSNPPSITPPTVLERLRRSFNFRP